MQVITLHKQIHGDSSNTSYSLFKLMYLLHIR